MRPALSAESLQSIYARIADGYDRRHALLTAWADRRGREALVGAAVEEGDRVLDCGSGTGSTGLLAARRVGPSGQVTLFDLSDAMLRVARSRAASAGVADQIRFESGDMCRLPFEDGSFDAVLSTYSVCPVYDPARAALEMYRVVRVGGRLGVAHSASAHSVLRPLADAIESLAWRFPTLTMGCRAVEVLPALREAGARVAFSRRIGVPLWPFAVFVVEKRPSGAESEG